jgi:hypothetical protein
MSAQAAFLVEEILARCLTDPPFLERLVADRDTALKAYPLDAQTRADFVKIDMQRLRRFSGFIAKVQHNYLWDYFPATRRLLQHSRIEIDFFTNYRAIQLSAQSPAQSQSDKVRRFADHLATFAAKLPGLAALTTALRYERACWELRQITPAPRPRGRIGPRRAAGLAWPDFLKLVPKRDQPMCFETFDCDPAALVADVLAGRFSPHDGADDRLFVLRRRRDQSVQTFEIEELSALLLSSIDGYRTVRSVIAAARRRALGATPPRAFRTFFEQAAAAQFIQLCRTPPCA